MLRIPLNIEYIKKHQKGLHIENTDLDQALEELDIIEEDKIAHSFSSYYLPIIDYYVPYRIVNIMVEIIHNSRQLCLSEYAGIRACEDYVVKTDWFQNLDEWAQNLIRKDFYHQIIDEIYESFHRRKQWKSKKQ
jgi:hypothetical protein